MTKVLRSLTTRFGALLMCALVATGCSHTPYSPAATAPFILSGLMPTGAMQTARVEMPEDTAVTLCPGQGRATCEVNWKFLQEGQSAAEVANWLGQPAQQIGPDIYIEKVVSQWRFQHNGVVYFENDELRYVDLPTAFDYTM